MHLSCKYISLLESRSKYTFQSNSSVLARSPLFSSSSPLNKRAFLVLGNKRVDFSLLFFFPLLSYHFRTFSIAAITRLMSSLALLRVSARTDLPDIARWWVEYFLKLAGSFRHNANKHSAQEEANAHARSAERSGDEREGMHRGSLQAAAALKGEVVQCRYPLCVCVCVRYTGNKRGDICARSRVLCVTD